MPLVGAEIHRVGSAFRSASLELSGAASAHRDHAVGETGTAACDTAVSAAMTDLGRVLDDLQTTSEECLQALGRYDAVTGDDGPAGHDAGHDEGATP